ncbi:MAG: NADH-quinone oxidoreductase subunit N [Acidobacteriota bacterium]
MLAQIINNLAFIKPEIALTLTFCAAILADLIYKNRPGIVAGTVLGGFIATGVLLGLQSGLSASLFNGALVIDPFSHYFKIVILGCAALIVLFSLSSNEVEAMRSRRGEYFTLLAAMALGMFLMVSATDLLVMYVTLELTSLSSYILSGSMKAEKDSSEASLKYLLYGAFSSGVMLYGISIVYGLTGTMNIFSINAAIASGTVSITALLVAGIFLMVGFGYKISAVPFHFWTPDVYEGAPITITAFLSVASKAAGFGMLMRAFKVVFIDGGVIAAPGAWAVFQGVDAQSILIVLSVLTMTLGNLVALWQENVKRLLAYSSIAHAGYMLLGLVVLGNDGFSATMLYFVIYMFMNLGAFYVVMLVANKTGSETMESYKGLGARAPFLAVAMAIFLVSLAGIPPTAGFIGKFYIFSALINAKMITLAVIGVMNSVISLYYYARVFRNMFLRESTTETTLIDTPVPARVLLLCLVIPTILLGLYFGPLTQFAQYSVAMFGIK